MWNSSRESCFGAKLPNSTHTRFAISGISYEIWPQFVTILLISLSNTPIDYSSNWQTPGRNFASEHDLIYHYQTRQNLRCFVPVYCHRDRKDCYGRDIRFVRTRSLKVCQDLCSVDCNCKSIQSWGTTCWLKRYMCSNTELRNSHVGNDYFKRGKKSTIMCTNEIGLHVIFS